MTDQVNRPAGMPAPVVAPVNEGLWRAAAEGRLDVQRCAGCGAHRYPPGDGCYRCSSLDWDWATLPGTGVIYSYTWIPDRSRDSGSCYNVAVVTLDGTEGEPVRVLSNVVDAWDPGDLDVGQRVEFAAAPFADDLSLPCFRMAGR